MGEGWGYQCLAEGAGRSPSPKRLASKEGCLKYRHGGGASSPLMGEDKGEGEKMTLTPIMGEGRGYQCVLVGRLDSDL